MTALVQAPLRRIGRWVRPSVKNVAWMLGGVAVATLVTVSAQQYTGGNTTNPPCDLGTAAQNAVNNRIRMIGLTNPDPDKYFNQNCLGDLAFADLDLSNLIPDALGWITDAMATAYQKLKQAAVNKVCTAARNAFGDTIGQYNSALNEVNGSGSAVGNYIDNQISNEAQQATDKLNYGYNVPANQPQSIFGASQPITRQAPPTTSSVTLLSNNASNASSYTVAAGNLEQARSNLAAARQSAALRAAESNTTVDQDPQVIQATAAYNSALSTYKSTAQQVTGGAAGSGLSPTVGGSIFGQ